MKKILLYIIILSGLLLMSSCGATPTTTTETLSPVDLAIEAEMKGSFDFFWEKANSTVGSAGYGLIADRAPSNPKLASIASVGFGLTAIPIGIEHGWITKEEGKARALGTLTTFENLYNQHGFYYHFLNMDTGARVGTTEISLIDSGLFITGALFIGQYFGGEVEQKAEALYARMDWNWFVDSSKDQFYMAYYPESPNFRGHWDFYAEQLILYVLAAGSPNPDYRIDESVYYGFTRHTASYGGGTPFINSWFGSIFTYQFSHAWVDFRQLEDKNGVNWFDNSVNATIANRQYAMDHSSTYKTFGENSWGMTASDGPNGYSGYYGSAPSGINNDQHKNDGTIAPAGAIGSIMFREEDVKNAILHFESIDGLKGPYGYYDAYNFDGLHEWIDGDVIGIDKGITLLMLQNYQNEMVWNGFMQNPYVQNGLTNLEFTDVSTQ